MPETFVSPGYGLDSYSNPIACDRCSALSCAEGDTFLQPCSNISDAVCIPCTQCDIGAQVGATCTTVNDTECVGCNSSLLPTNASWTKPGCNAWACDSGFVLRPNTTQCIKCKVTSDCIYSDSFEDDGTGCGRCVACDLFLLLPGQCFNGDGQCGVSYLCDVGMVVGTAIPPPASVAAESAVVDSPTTAMLVSMATLTIVAEMASLTASFIEDLDAQTSANCACEATVMSITQGNVTTFCNPGCLLPHSRRMLLQESHIAIDIALVGNALAIPRTPVFGQQTVIAWQTYESQIIYDPTLLSDRRRLVVQFRRAGNLREVPVEHESVVATYYYIAIGVVLAIIVLSVFAACGKKTQARGDRHRDSEEDEDRVRGCDVKDRMVRRATGKWRPPQDFHADVW